MWRISLVFCLIIITFVSLLPSRVWWRSLVFLLGLSLLVGFLSLIASSDIQTLDGPLRDPNELNLILESKEKWNVLEIPSNKIGFITFGPYNLSRKAFELGIKTSTLIFTVIHSVNLMLLTTLQEDIVWALSWFMIPFRKFGLPIDKWLFQLLLALRFIPLVQEELQNIINSEDKTSPFNDDTLVQLLNDKGYNLARRTVAKYRDQLGLPVARLRKEI